MEIHILGSGSSGNAILIKGKSGNLLVDAGMSCRKLTKKLADCGSPLSSLLGIFLTHEHGDHTAALKTLCKQHPTPIYANPQTASALKFRLRPSSLNANWQLFQTGSRISLESFQITSFPVQHDASEPVGFRIEENGLSFSILTDLGKVTESAIRAAKDVHCIFIEANYDPDLLDQDTKRPWSIKQRIANDIGHLSNESAAQALASMATSKLQTVILGHLSSDCNCPHKATSLIASHLASSGFPHVSVLCAEREQITPKISIS